MKNCNSQFQKHKHFHCTDEYQMGYRNVHHDSVGTAKDLSILTSVRYECEGSAFLIVFTSRKVTDIRRRVGCVREDKNHNALVKDRIPTTSRLCNADS